jgi:hypothetical protein
VLALDTYDGSGQTVHPDVVAWSPPFATTAFLLAVTPYPFGDAADENPSVFTGDGRTWQVPPGLRNPVARPAAGHLSDPDVVHDPTTGRLRLYYREASDRNRIWLVESTDGVAWGAPRLVVTGANHTVLSPAVVLGPDGQWRMWAVDGEGGCSAARAWLTLRRSADGVRWSEPERVALDQPGFFPWHVDVQWIAARREYWAVYNGKVAGSCTTPALFLATSPDGVRWTTYPAPLLARGAIPAFADIVYRASFRHDPADDTVTLWHSGARYDRGRYVWSSAVERRGRGALFAALAVGNAARSAPTVTDAPPLTEFP